MQNIHIFKRGGGDQSYIIVPTSPPASVFPISCTCSSAGGFEGGNSAGIVGCVPCEDGFYSSPGMPSCQMCPRGKYSAQLKEQRNYYTCPTADSPAIRFGPNYNWKPAFYDPATCLTLTVGAHECTACPPDRPYTLAAGSKSVSECTRCPELQYYDETERRCKDCRPRSVHCFFLGCFQGFIF